MNKLQQEIKDFHEKLSPALTKVLALYKQGDTRQINREFIKSCKKLLQKCSFKSLMDVSELCSVAYWLYIYGHKELALEICELTHGVDFAYEYSWPGFPELYGLEIRIAREILGEERKGNIPPNLVGYYLSKGVRKKLRYPQILREEITAAHNEGLLRVELIYALYDMIGKGETGLYTELNRNWTKIEETICMYIDYLKLE